MQLDRGFDDALAGYPRRARSRRVAAGDSLLDPSVTAEVLKRVRNPMAAADPRLARLTPTERRILELIAGGHTNRQIGER